MDTITVTLNSLAATFGISSGVLKLLLLLLLFPFGAVLLVVMLVVRTIGSVGKLVRGIITHPVWTLLALASAVWLGFAGWDLHGRFQEHSLLLAVGSPNTESYRLAGALQSVTALDAPHIKINRLEFNAAADGAGMLDNGIVQLAVVPDNLPLPSSARSIALWSGATPQLLLARFDVDEQVAYALAQALGQFKEEAAPDNANGTASPQTPTEAQKASGKAGKAGPQASVAKIQRPTTKAAGLLHPGAAAFYDWDKTPFVRRYPRLILLVSAGLVLLGLWTLMAWQVRRHARQRQKTPSRRSLPWYRKIWWRQRNQTILPASPLGREPWTFEKILRESVGEAATSRPQNVVPDERNQWRIRGRNLSATVQTWGWKRKPIASRS